MTEQPRRVGGDVEQACVSCSRKRRDLACRIRGSRDRQRPTKVRRRRCEAVGERPAELHRTPPGGLDVAEGGGDVERRDRNRLSFFQCSPDLACRVGPDGGDHIDGA
jgi:hypothetical protein